RRRIPPPPACSFASPLPNDASPRREATSADPRSCATTSATGPSRFRPCVTQPPMGVVGAATCPLVQRDSAPPHGAAKRSVGSRSRDLADFRPKEERLAHDVHPEHE